MKERIERRYVGTVEKWNSLDKNQKVKITTAFIILLVTICAFLFITFKKDTEILMKNLTLTQVGEIQGVLSDNGIYSEATNTAIKVYPEDAIKAQLLLSQSNVTDSDRFTFETALSYTGMGTTDSVRRKVMIKEKADEISTGLETIDGINSALVTLEVPESSDFFITDSPASSASVMLTTTKDFTSSEARGIARYIASGVEGLSTENIEILDQKNNTIFSGKEMSEGSYSYAYDREIQRKNEIEKKIKAQLIPLYNQVEVTTNLVLDNSNQQVYSEKYENPTGADDSSTGYVNREESESQSVESGSSGAEPGYASNDGTINTYEMGSGDNSSAEVEKNSTDYKYNYTQTSSDSLGGNVIQDKSSISLIVYNYKEYNEETLENNGTLDNTTWDEYKQSINQTPLEIDDGIIENVRLGTGIENVSVIGYELPVFIDKITTPVDIQQIIMYVVLALLILLLAIALIRSNKNEEITEEIEPELSVEDLLVSTQVEEEKEIERLKEIEFNEENAIKGQIDQFIKDKPDAVAQLLRNWINDDWE